MAVGFFSAVCESVIFLTALFSVMCYNVLCDKYATRQLYGYCPSWALNWDYRKKAIIQEILSCNADIISLQVSHAKDSFKLCDPSNQNKPRSNYTRIYYANIFEIVVSAALKILVFSGLGEF